MGQEFWMEKYEDLTSIYCYVFNNLTWNYESCYTGDTMLTFEKLKPCVHFLLDACLHEFMSTETTVESVESSSLDLLEVITSLEMIITIGDQDGIDELWKHP